MPCAFNVQKGSIACIKTAAARPRQHRGSGSFRVRCLGLGSRRMAAHPERRLKRTAPRPACVGGRRAGRLKSSGCRGCVAVCGVVA